MKLKTTNNNTTSSKHIRIARCLWGISLPLAFAGIVFFLAAQQYKINFDVPFQSFLFTMANSKEGSNISFIFDMILAALPSLLILTGSLAVLAWCFLQGKLISYLVLGKKQQFRVSIQLLSGWIILVLSLFISVRSVLLFCQTIGLSAYLEFLNLPASTVYETYYVNANDVSITPPKQKKNLIYIYLESMESAYTSFDNGGNQETDYIPFASQLAKENISFSNTDRLGGFAALPGTTWTMSALFATQTGTPFGFPVDQNDMSSMDSFAPSLRALGNILSEDGYVQEFLCGSIGEFGGRSLFFRDHGNFEIYDYYTAIENGIIPEDYWVFWGYEDKRLYEVAKSELQRLSQQDQPFNFTMLTVDTHFAIGYICDLCEPCGDSPQEQTAAIVACADRQFKDFIQWLQQQSFYEDSVIVISGDHPRMDTYLVENLSYYDRRIYNCFLNASVEPAGETTFREFSTMDMFPTTLAALGYEIEGDRLGFGTNLFSPIPTLVEEHSIDFWHTELQKRSEYFDKYLSH